MVNIREAALTYEPPTTKNITDLQRVSTNLELIEKKFKEGTPEQFTVKVIVVDGEEYRVPTSVISQLQMQLIANPTITHFRVSKKGEGMKTEYTVIPLMGAE